MSSPAPSALDPRLPVIVGVGQLSLRTDAGDAALSPVEMAAEAARLAAADAGGADPGRLLAALDTVGIMNILSWRYSDPAALVAAELGADPARRWTTTVGGSFPQTMLNRAAADISAGRADAVLIGGAEAFRTRTRVRHDLAGLGWFSQDPEAAPTEVLGDPSSLSHPDELAVGLVLPASFYAIFESALRAAAGRTQAEHQRLVSELWAGFSAVAATNPHAWIQRAFTAEEIRTVGPDNRMVGHPYPKLMNANAQVDQAAALIVCSVERARALGVSPDRWVFPWAGTDASDTWHVSNRLSLHSSPAIRIAGREALRQARLDVDDLGHVDLYSCFPSAVEVAAQELGLGLERPLTVTGGLSFAGGPWNNCVTHSIANMVEVLRADAGASGLVTANGGYLTKHAFGVYSTDPPPRGRFVAVDCQPEVDAVGSVPLASDHEGGVRIEGATVMFERDGTPTTALLATRTPDRARAWARSTDPDVMALITDDEPVGVAARRRADGTLTL